ncbi:MAG: flap endonuclease [Chromatiales bacterium]|nr:flap endonuclease [Chromatiales bacterium]
MDNTDRLYLVDASIYIFRSWFALSDNVRNAQGQPANAVYGFCDFVLKLLSDIKPENIVFAFDESLETSYRNEIYPSYKANRAATPEELKAQFAHCREFIVATGLAEIASSYYEADDLIGTLTHQAHQRGQSVVIVSRDKDLMQLLEGNDIWWDYSRNLKLSCQGVADRFGVLPEQIADMLAITGDAVDNIPGVPGIGPKTATKLIQHFGSIKQLLAEVGGIANLNIRGAHRIEGLVREYTETIKMAYRLTTICRDVSLPNDFATRVGEIDHSRLEALFALLGFGVYRRRRWTECLASLATES